MVKNPPAKAGDPCSIPGSGRFPGEGSGKLVQYSCLENPMVRGAWRTTVHGVTKEVRHSTTLNRNNKPGRQARQQHQTALLFQEGDRVHNLPEMPQLVWGTGRVQGQVCEFCSGPPDQGPTCRGFPFETEVNSQHLFWGVCPSTREWGCRDQLLAWRVMGWDCVYGGQ